MANLVQLANDLEFVSKEQLIQMSQDPNSEYPSFLVLSEIQRRTQLDKAYEAQKPKPQTSVAEELVAEFSNSPSGLGAMAQSPDLQQAFPSGDMGNMAPPSPMQMMAAGGRTGYQAGSVINNLSEFTPDASSVYGGYGSLEEFVRAQEAARSNAIGIQPMTIEDSARMLESEGVPPEMIYDNYEPQQSGFGISSLVPLSVGPFPTGVLQSLISTYGPEALRKAGVIREDGSVDYTQAALLGSMAIPGTAVARVTGGVLKGLGKKAISKFKPQVEAAKKGIISRFTKPDVKGPVKIKRVQPKVGKRKDGKIGAETPTGPGGAAQRIFPKGNKGRARSLNIPSILRDFGLFGSIGTLGGIGISRLIESQKEKDAEQAKIDEENRLLADAKEKADEEKRLAEEAERLAKIEAEKNRLLAEEKKRRGSDLLIGLGGAIGSARNLGELSSGISDTYFKLREAEEGLELKGLQGRLLEAQISKIELEVANMPLDIAIKQYQSLNDLVDSGVLTAEEAKIREDALSKRIQQLQGITADQKSEKDELLGLVKVV